MSDCIEEDVAVEEMAEEQQAADADSALSFVCPALFDGAPAAKTSEAVASKYSAGDASQRAQSVVRRTVRHTTVLKDQHGAGDVHVRYMVFNQSYNL